MLSLAFLFLVLAIVATLLGASGVSALAMNIAWILFVVGIIFAVIHLVLGRRSI